MRSDNGGPAVAAILDLDGVLVDLYMDSARVGRELDAILGPEGMSVEGHHLIAGIETACAKIGAQCRGGRRPRLGPRLRVPVRLFLRHRARPPVNYSLPRRSCVLSPKLLKQLAEQHGTPLFVVDHREVRRNYATFRKHLPRVQAYYAVKANPDPGIVRTLFKAGASFDVASMSEFMIVHENIQSMPAKKRQDWIWD